MKFNKLLPITLLAISALVGCQKKPTPKPSESEPEQSEPTESELPTESEEESEPIDSEQESEPESEPESEQETEPESEQETEPESEQESEQESETEPEVVYTVAITNKEALQEKWVLGDAARAVNLTITADGEEQNPTLAILEEELVITSSDPDVVTVSSQSLQLGTKAGAVTITAAYHGETDSVDLVVEEAEDNTMSLEEIWAGYADETIKSKDTVEFNAQITGAMDLLGNPASGDSGHAYAGVYTQDGDYAMLLYAGKLGEFWESLDLEIGDAVHVVGSFEPYGRLLEVKPSDMRKCTEAEAEALAAPTTVEVTAANYSADALTPSAASVAHVTDLVFKNYTVESESKRNITINAAFVDEEGKETPVVVFASYHLVGALDAVVTFLDTLHAGDYFEADGFVSFNGNNQQFALGHMNGKTPAECLTKLDKDPVQPMKLTVTGDAEVEEGAKTTLTAAVLPSMASQDVTWETSDDSIATVENGVVTGVNAGTATITARSAVKNTVYGTHEITVTAAAVDAESLTIEAAEGATGAALGETVELSATVLPAGAPQKVIYESSDTNIATVDGNVVTFVGDGEVTITGYATKLGEKVDSVSNTITLSTKVTLSTLAELKAAATKDASEADYQFRGVVVSKIASNNQMIVTNAEGGVQSFKTDYSVNTPKIGDVVVLVGKIQLYYGVVEFASAKAYYSAVAVENAVGTGDAAAKTGAEFNAFADLAEGVLPEQLTGQYVKLENAVLTKSGKYVNVTAVGETAVVSQTYAIEGITLDDFVGVEIEYLTGHLLTRNSSSKAVTIWVDHIELKPAEKHDIVFGAETDGADSAVNNPGEYRYWNDQNWCGSNVTVSEHYEQGGELHFELSSTGTCWYGFQIFFKNPDLTVGTKYTVTVVLEAKNAQKVWLMGQSTPDEEPYNLVAGENTLSEDYVEAAATASFSMQFDIADEIANTIVIKSVTWKEYVEPVEGNVTVTFDPATLIDNPDSYTGGSVQVGTLALDEVATLSIVTEGSAGNSGKIYKSNDYGFQVRLYNSTGAYVKVTLSAGYEIVSATISGAAKGSNWWVAPVESDMTISEDKLTATYNYGGDSILYGLTIVYKAAE